MSEERIRKYETIVVTRNDAGYEAQQKLHTKLTEMMEAAGVRPIRFELWGKRRLAYQINKATKGIYYYHLYLGTGSFLKEMNRMLKLSSITLRYMTLVLQDHVDPETYDFEAEKHFDTLPTEADERKDRSGSRTGWNEELSAELLPPADKKSPDSKDEPEGTAAAPKSEKVEEEAAAEAVEVKAEAKEEDKKKTGEDSAEPDAEREE